MMLAERIILFVINWKLTNGDFDLFSIIIKRNNEIVATDKNRAI